MPSRQPASTKTEPANDRKPSVAHSADTADALSGLQHAVGNQAVTQMLAAQAVQTKLSVGTPGDRFEQEAESIANAVISGRSADAPSVQHTTSSEGVQRLCAECEEEETLRRAPADESTAQEANATTETAPAAASETAEIAPTEPALTSAPALLVDDEAETVQPDQMRKSDFLSMLRDAVCATANEGLASAGQTTTDCPWVEYWFANASGKDARYVEKGIRKYAPETGGASSAEDMVSIVTTRVRQSVDAWVRTGEITGVPEGFGDAAGSGSGADAGGLFFKARPGGPGHVTDPAAIRDRLGAGRPLPARVRTRMESAFGSRFSGVRVHTDANAAGLSDSLNARAFTVGEHVAFGAGEYRPGSLVGDALLAHELAHVVQQGGASAASAPMRKGAGEDSALEEDADRAAVGAVSSLWARVGSAGRQAANSLRPAMQSGLTLSRCSKSSSPTANVGPKKTVTVNDTTLSGGSGTLASALTYANTRVYNQANVEIKQGASSTLDDPKSKVILGADLIVDEYTNPSSPTTEEKDLLKENQSAGAVSVYFVKGFDKGSLGEAFWAAAGSGFIGVIVGSTRPENTFSHELGHVLLDDGGHSVPDDTYLMHSTATDPTKLTPDQINKIRSSPYAT
jgi:hypothetical protein